MKLDSVFLPLLIWPKAYGLSFVGLYNSIHKLHGEHFKSLSTSCSCVCWRSKKFWCLPRSSHHILVPVQCIFLSLFPPLSHDSVLEGKWKLSRSLLQWHRRGSRSEPLVWHCLFSFTVWRRHPKLGICTKSYWNVDSPPPTSRSCHPRTLLCTFVAHLQSLRGFFCCKGASCLCINRCVSISCPK